MLLGIELSCSLGARGSSPDSVSAMLSNVAFLIGMNWLVMRQIGRRFLVHASTMVGK